MSDVKWIKITTDMFEDEKIDFISSLPEADAILVIWIRLLTMAGKCNAGGYIYLTEKIPYTDEMLAHKFKKPISIIKLALQTFHRLDMIEADDKGIFLLAWEKHQNVEGLDKIREQTKLRTREYRERKKLQALPAPPPEEVLRHGDVTVTEDVTHGDALDIELELDKEIDTIYSSSDSQEENTALKTVPNQTTEHELQVETPGSANPGQPPLGSLLSLNSISNELAQQKEKIILTTDEAEFMSVLESVKGYPLDRQKDLEYYHTLTMRYPTLDLLGAVKDWAIYKVDKPLKPKDNARSQINNWCQNAVKWKKNLKKTTGPPDKTSFGKPDKFADFQL